MIDSKNINNNMQIILENLYADIMGINLNFRKGLIKQPAFGESINALSR